MGTVELITSIALAVALAVALFLFIRKCIKSKDWSKLFKFALSMIQEAEEKFIAGEDKLAYASDMITKMASEIGFKISDEEVVDMIENVIAVTKKVNIGKK